VDAEAGVVVSLLPFFSKLISMGEAINLWFRQLVTGLRIKIFLYGVVPINHGTYN
jgi:hypothetical protein